jgi:hypothetical protein
MATTEIAAGSRELDAGMMIRRALFLLLLIGVTYFYLGIDFRGLSHEKGMDQAQIARQIAKDSSFSTLCIRPLAFRQVEKQMKMDEGPSASPSFAGGIPDTYHAPLNPILNSIILGLSKESWKFSPKQILYTPDVMIAGFSMILLLASIGVTYLLISRIFDARIGGVSALLMLLSSNLWAYAQSGLPQMLMLFLFSFGTFFLYKAIENLQAGRPVYLWIGLTGAFFGLLALAHWIAVWPFIGLVIFASFYFFPRGIQMLILVGVFLLITAWWPFMNNQRYTGNPLGAGLYLFYAGMGGSNGETTLMRDLEQTAGGLNFDGFLSRSITTALSQIGDIYHYLGGIVVAPLFFLALIHPFRRREIADFRWCILLMWIFAVIGMTLYSIQPRSEDATDPNNLHLLFIPLFTGYGLAFLSVLWNRLNLPLQLPIVRNGHYILAVLISSLPTLLNLPLRIKQAVTAPDMFKTHFPQYVPRALAEMGTMIGENEAVATDIPWAVAWYMDRAAILLPKDRSQLDTLRAIGKERGQPITGLLFSYKSLSAPLTQVTYERMSEFDWRNYLMIRPMMRMAKGQVQQAEFQSQLLSELPIKNQALTGTVGDSVYLFLTENQVTRKENTDGR